MEVTAAFSEENEEDITKEENYMNFLGKFNREVKEVEDSFRKQFLERKPNEFSSNIGNELLIDVFAEKHTFTHENISSFQGWKGEFLFGIGRSLKIDEDSIDTETNFHGNWKLLTSEVFQGVDWTNLVVAGGAVLGPLRKSKILHLRLF
jgi:hypothetical protein